MPKTGVLLLTDEDLVPLFFDSFRYKSLIALYVYSPIFLLVMDFMDRIDRTKVGVHV